MAGAERVIFALVALAESGQASALAQGADAVAPAGQDLVRIGLVADIPDELVLRRVEHLVERDGELHHAEAGAKMAAGHRDCIDGLLAELCRDLRQVVVIEGAQIFWMCAPGQAAALDFRRSFAPRGELEMARNSFFMTGPLSTQALSFN